MKRLGLIPVLPAVLAALLLPASAAARVCVRSDCQATNVVSVHVGTFMRLSLGAKTTVSARPTRAPYELRHEERAGPSAIVKANGAWMLQISTAEATWTMPGGTFAGLSTAAAAFDTALPLSSRPRVSRTRTHPLVVRLTLVGA